MRQHNHETYLIATESSTQLDAALIWLAECQTLQVCTVMEVLMLVSDVCSHHIS